MKETDAEYVDRALKELNAIPRNIYRNRNTNDLTEAGWRQCDSNGLFFDSMKDPKDYFVALSLPTQDYGHIRVRRDGDMIERFDSVPGESLRHLSEKLQDLQIWLA